MFLYDYGERIKKIKWLYSLQNSPWVIIGDFGMVEDNEDKFREIEMEWKDIENNSK